MILIAIRLPSAIFAPSQLNFNSLSLSLGAKEQKDNRRNHPLPSAAEQQNLINDAFVFFSLVFQLIIIIIDTSPIDQK